MDWLKRRPVGDNEALEPQEERIIRYTSHPPSGEAAILLAEAELNRARILVDRLEHLCGLLRPMLRARDPFAG